MTMVGRQKGQKYSIVFIVPRRMMDAFTTEQIEAAARIFFFMHPPPEVQIFTDPDDLKLIWHDDLMRDLKMIQVTGNVTPEEEIMSHDAYTESHEDREI